MDDAFLDALANEMDDEDDARLAGLYRRSSSGEVTAYRRSTLYGSRATSALCLSAEARSRRRTKPRRT